MRHTTRCMLIAMLFALLGGEALAQFDTPGSTNFRERIVGDLLEGGGNGGTPITPELGDQVGAFFEDQIVGLFTYTDETRDFSVTIFGDNPNSAQVEGPVRGERVEFRFFDSSTNQTLPLTVLNQQGEVFNFRFQGVEVFEVPGLPLDLTPTRTFNLRAGAPSDGGGGGGGGGGGSDAPGGGTDINGDGDTDVRDAAIVLRALTGAVRPGSRAFRDLGVMVSDVNGRETDTGNGEIELSADELLSRCDVNGDGMVTSQDAVAILTSGRAGNSRAGATPDDGAGDGAG